MSTLKYKTESGFDYLGSKISGDTLPIGSIIPFAGTSTPAGWLICDGRTLLRSEYKTLFSVIGTKYGEGDGSTTFNIPDLRGRVLAGINTNDADFANVGKTGGEKTHTLQVDELPTDALTFHSMNDGNFFAQYSSTNKGNFSSQLRQTTPHNNLQPYIVTNYIIKASQTAGYVGTISGTKSNSDKDTYSCSYVNDLITIKNFTVTKSIEPNSAAYDQRVTLSPPIGYKAIGVMDFGLSGAYYTECFVNKLEIEQASNILMYSIKNTSAHTVSLTLNVRILYVKS